MSTPPWDDPDELKKLRIVKTDEPDEVQALGDGHRGTDSGNADRFVAFADGQARYVGAWNKWLVYHDGRWEQDDGAALATELARKVPRQMFQTAAVLDGGRRDDLWKHARHSESARAVGSMLHLARGAPGIEVVPVVVEVEVAVPRSGPACW